MARVLSVDLALRDYESFGCCLLDSETGESAAAEFPLPSDAGLHGRPDPERCAGALAEFCHRQGVNVVLLDGPQAWKDPLTKNGHARVCEHALNTPGKMGLPPDGVLPGPFLAFGRFSVDLFAALGERGAVRPDFEPFTVPTEGFLLLESYPAAAWRALGLQPPPSKSKAKLDDPQQACLNLSRLLPVRFRHAVNHDEAQALVAGLAGVAVALGNERGYKAVGAPLQLRRRRPPRGLHRPAHAAVPGQADRAREPGPRSRPALAAVTPCLPLLLLLLLLFLCHSAFDVGSGCGTAEHPRQRQSKSKSKRKRNDSRRPLDTGRAVPRRHHFPQDRS